MTDTGIYWYITPFQIRFFKEVSSLQVSGKKLNSTICRKIEKKINGS